MLRATENGKRFELDSPVAMPRAAGFLWNKKMMIQVNCRGFAVAQYMQPEPAKYAYAPNLEAKTFMQPEQPYYAHHPGRFVYIKDEESGELFSAPYEPVRQSTDLFTFSVGLNDITWTVEHLGIRVQMQLSLPKDDVLELWEMSVTNLSERERKISVYPYWTVGYMSWMNQSARYRPDLGAVVANCVTPYQKVEDYFKNKDFKDKTFFLHNRIPQAYECAREAFEGEGGLHKPGGTSGSCLANGDALYETPAAVLQYRLNLAARQQEDFKFLFGPAKDDQEIISYRDRYFSDKGFSESKTAYGNYIAEGAGLISIDSPDQHLNQFVNHWLPRQVYYHGDVNRLSTDPQTRNYLQDNMGMTYIKPQVCRQAFIQALSQQEESGAIPDGILLSREAQLKYINQIPHTDHCVWLPVCLQAYLDETNDYAILQEPAPSWRDETQIQSVQERINRAMHWLLDNRDPRGLIYIAQGDWCDPMNMVGYKGKGVSGWLSVATAYALRLWAEICEFSKNSAIAQSFRSEADKINAAVNKHLWDGNWYGRGITDDDVIFGIAKDPEGRIFLNPQSWSILAGTASAEQRALMIRAVEQQLETPYGVMMLAPAYTDMREDVGRVTQKHPGSAENGSIYNHAAIFYIYSLYTIGESERAFKLLRQMLSGPDPEDYLQRGQMPVYVPNYYRGAYYQHPRTAGRSSQLFNTGTASWLYRCVIEGLFGLKGCLDGLAVKPNLPKHWEKARAVREFRGATFTVNYQRSEDSDQEVVAVDGQIIEGSIINNIQSGKHYKVHVTLPGSI